MPAIVLGTREKTEVPVFTPYRLSATQYIVRIKVLPQILGYKFCSNCEWYIGLGN